MARRAAKKTIDYVDRAKAYASGVVDGDIVACKLVHKACRRFLDDVIKARGKAYPYKLDSAKANRFCQFAELMPHVKGKWSTKTIVLENWQCFIYVNMFGWVRKYSEAKEVAGIEVLLKAGTRRFVTTYIEVGRKNTKSTMGAIVGNYMFAMDDEDGAEVYSAATTRDQAKIVWGIAKQQVRRLPEFRRRHGVVPHAHTISQDASASKFEPLSADHSSLDGLNVHCAIVDEVHAHKNRHVYDVIETATGSRQQPIIMMITTAGTNRAGICYEQRGYLVKILDGVVEDDTYFGMVYTLDEEDMDNWSDPMVWAKSNPNLGVSVSIEDLMRKCRKALQTPSAVNNFLTKHLNVWVNADSAWMDMQVWKACGDPAMKIEQFDGEPCIPSLDLASRDDIAAFMRVFYRWVDKELHFYIFGRYYLPEEVVENSSNSQYSGWVRAGRIVATPGNTIDYDYIEEDLRESASDYQVEEVAYDPFQATQFSTRMVGEGFPMVEMRPNALNFSEPMKEIEAAALDSRLHHDGDPVLEWMVSNVVCHTDKKDNIYPNKERKENKIDGVVASIMSVGRIITREIDGGFIYEKQGIRSL